MSLLHKQLPLWVLILTLPLACGLGGVAGWFAASLGRSGLLVATGELREATGTLTSPLLECEVFSGDDLKSLRPFRHKVEQLLETKIASGAISDGSVYFRDLNNGLWFGVGEDRKYHPASLLKVPIMIAWFRRAERDPALLGTKVIFPGDFDLSRWQGIRPSTELVPGQSYTVDELIVRMISMSDNNAAQLLVNHIDPQEIDNVLNDLDVNVNPADPEHFVSLHGYAGFFRVLFNASYLSRAYSEKALAILSRSAFTEGLRDALPAGIVVASKFGESGVGADPDIVQLHEVGIIYFPGRPYLLGIMTRGKRGADLTAVLREISLLVYESVAAQQSAPSVPMRMFR